MARTHTRRWLRSLPAFQSLVAEAGYAAESGGAIHVALGSGGLASQDAVTSLAAIELIDELADTFVLYNAPPIITVGDPTLLPPLQDSLRRAYERHGLEERYEKDRVPDRVRFIAPSPVAYAAGAGHVVASEDVTTNVVIGDFGHEASLLTDAGARRNLSQSAAAARPEALGVLYPATDRLAAGEELYAAGAIRETLRYRVSLIAEDLIRVFLVLIILLWALVELLVSL